MTQYARPAAFVCLVVVVVIVCGPLNTEGVAQTLSLPFPANEVWYVCQGYNGPVSHQNAFALDLSIDANSTSGLSGCSPATASASIARSVLAPASGNLVQLNSADLVCINLDQGGSLLIGHIAERHPNGRVSGGDKIGSVAAPNTLNGQYRGFACSSFADQQHMSQTIALLDAEREAFVSKIGLPDPGNGFLHLIFTVVAHR